VWFKKGSEGLVMGGVRLGWGGGRTS